MNGATGSITEPGESSHADFRVQLVAKASGLGRFPVWRSLRCFPAGELGLTPLGIDSLRYPVKSSHQTHRLWTAFACVMLLTIAAATADRLQLLSGLRLKLHDALSPGRLLVSAIAENPDHPRVAESNDPQSQVIAVRLHETDQQRRALLIENARLRNRLRQLKDSNGHINHHVTLTGFDLISARVLSRCGMPPLLRQTMIDAGKAHGLTQSQLVLDSRGILLDRGVRSGVSEGRPVLDGSVVLGRIDRVGRWVSQLVPVTNKSYSARIRLVRHSSRGTQPGVEGLLEGTGETCRITGVPDTASVAVGDEVFSADIEGIAGPNLYYGTVIGADFESAAGWSITVKPAVRLAEIEDVSVLVPRLNEDRLASTRRQPARRRNQ